MAAIVQTQGLTKRFGEVVAVDSVDLRVEQGEVYGFLGLNGAGKTTTIRALQGLIRPTGGAVWLFGERVKPGGRGPWHRVGHLVAEAAAYPELSVRENLEIGRRLHRVRGRRRQLAPSTSSGWRRTPTAAPPHCRWATCSGWGWPGRFCIRWS